MKGCHGPLWVAALLLSLSLGLLPVSAEAKDDCRVIRGGSSADALGEEFPEVTAVAEDNDVSLGDAALGEEFPELFIFLPFVGALGEEFPELILFGITRAALGEEFPE
jgi:hypothetical protein